MILAQLQLEGVHYPWLWLLLIAAGAGLTYFTYRQIYLRSKQRLTWGLMALRGGGLLMLVLALAKPTWTSETDLVDPGRVAVVIDDSISMSLEGRYARAVDAVNRLRQSIRSGSGPAMEVDLFNIHGERIEAEPPAKPASERTDLVRAVNASAAQLRSKPLVGVVVVSDGVDNTGREAATELAESSTPIYAVGFPSDADAARLDLEVRRVQAPASVMVDNKAEIVVTIAKTAGPPVQATVSIKRGSDPPVDSTVELKQGRGEQQVTLGIQSSEAGSFVYTASVSTTAGEKLLANNARHFPLEVQADAIGVLYLEGFLRYEYKYLKKRLEDDPDVQLVAAVRRANPDRPGVADRVEITPDLLKNLDLVILGDMEANYLRDAEYRALLDWIEKGPGDESKRSHSLLVLGGYRSFGAEGFRSTPLADALPVVFVDGETVQSEDPFVLQLTESGKQHPIFRITGDRVQDAALWGASPPLLGSSLVQRAKAGADVLAVNPGFTIDKKPAVVIASGRYGSGQAMVMGADTTWRWTRQARVAGKSDTLYARFWSQSIRWLTGRDLEKDRAKLVVSTDRPAYDAGKEVAIRITRPADDESNGDLAVDIIDENGRRTLVQVRSRSNEPNVFLGSFYPSTGGRFEVDARLVADGKTVANQTTEFLVHGSDLELSDTGVNRALLRAIAKRSGGVYVDIDEADQLSKLIERKERRISQTERTEYWNSPLLFLLFLAAVTGEWVLRRRNHLV